MIEKKTIREIHKLKKDNKSGANEFIDKALKIIISQLNSIEDQNKNIDTLIFKLSKEIMSSRHSMAPLTNIIGYIIHDLENINKKNLLLRISQLREKREEMLLNLTENFLLFLNNLNKSNFSLILISYSSTIIELLNKYDKNNLIIYVLESRPLFEGQRVAKILSKRYETHLIIDAAMGKFINKIDFALVGVDSLLKDGSIINKIGTFPLAVLIHSTNKKIYAICDSFKYNILSHYGFEVEIQEKPIKEVYNKVINSNLFKVHNYYFDKTPPDYIDGIISDLGILTIKEFIEKVKNILPIDWFKKYID